MIWFILSIYLISAVEAGQFAPHWLKEGTYVKYTTDKLGYAYISNNSALSFWNATFCWNCVNINETVAKVKVTFDYVGKTLDNSSLGNATLRLTGDVYVILSTRTVYGLNGSLLGTTHIWIPANPAEGQEVVVWDIGSDKVTLPAQVNNVWIQTIQGKQAGFILDGNGSINGNSRNFGVLCDLDTGLMIDGSFEWDPIMTGAGINALLLNGHIILSDTNIALGPAYDPTNWSTIISLITLPILAFAVLLVLCYKHMHKKR